MSGDLAPSEDNPLYYRGRRNDKVYHTRKCSIFHRLDNEKFFPVPDDQEDEFTHCKMCKNELDRSNQRKSYAHALRSGELQVTKKEDRSHGELEVEVEKVEEPTP